MSRDAQLATLTRQAQWLLEELAFELPTGCSTERRAAVADVLDELAAALRAEPAREVIEVVGTVSHER